MQNLRPKGVVAGFHAENPNREVPELVQIGEQWLSADHMVPVHTHTVWEFHLQISGESRWSGLGQTYTLMAGYFLAVPPNIRHQMHEKSKIKHHFFFVVFDFSPVVQRHPKLEKFWRQKLIVVIPRAESLMAPFRQLIHEVAISHPLPALGLRLTLDHLVLEASRLFLNRKTPSSLVAVHPAVLRAKERLEKEPSRRWTLSNLSQVSGLSACHLAERFTRDVGIPPHQYLLQMRIERAKEMLRQSDLPITDLALEMGFSSSQHFASAFKRLTGVTPQHYRSGPCGCPKDR